MFAEDASTAFQNPSGLFNLEKDSNWMVTGVVVDSKVEFETTKATTVVKGSEPFIPSGVTQISCSTYWVKGSDPFPAGSITYTAWTGNS